MSDLSSHADAPFSLAGRMEFRSRSPQLRGNALGDSHERPVWVLLPPGYDDTNHAYPTIYVLPGYGGHLEMWLSHGAHRPSVPEAIDASFRDSRERAALVIFVDGWTSLGGSQYLDSFAIGRYQSYLCQDVVTWVDHHYRTIPDRDYRAVTGKSSGGYGAMMAALTRPEVFGAFATHAGDAMFDLCYRAFLPHSLRWLRDEYDNSYASYFSGLSDRPFGTRSSDNDLLEMYVYAAAYSSNPDGTVDMPYRPDGSLEPAVWQRWLDLDPVLVADQPRGRAAIANLRAAWIDAGLRDQYYLDFAADVFHRKVRQSMPDPTRVHFELFDDDHDAIEYRYPMAIAWLARQLTD